MAQEATEATAAVAAAADDASPPLAWGVVCLMYLGGFALCVLFAVLQAAELAPEALDGAWIIFVPFGPCLGYALYRYRQERDRKRKVD
jgi:hypothetical protein